MVSAGSTGNLPLATDCHFQASRSGNIGVPIPGTELKLVASGDKLEVRVRGPNVTPGYWKASDLTAQAFDAEGFYLIGDAVKFADPDRPELGLFFDGRVAEDFKLNSGTWVSVGTLRVAGIAALAPLAQDIVVTGRGGDEVRFLVFPNIAACRAHAGLGDGADVSEVIHHEKIRGAIAQGLARLKAQGSHSSGHATRALLLAEPASVDGGEITDKGYINQRAVLTRRAAAGCSMTIRRLSGSAAPFEQRAARSDALRLFAGNGAEIVVQATQQVDQQLPFVFVEAGQQSAFPVERGDDHLVMRRASPCGQRNRVAAAIVRIGPDRDQPALLHGGEGPADRPLVEPDDVADPRRRDAGLDRQLREDAPLRDVDAEIPAVDGGCAIRQFVGDKGNVGWNVTIEIELWAAIVVCALC